MNQSSFAANPDVGRRLRAAAEVGRARDMVKAGVGILVGCDMMIAAFCLHDELVAMVRGV